MAAQTFIDISELHPNLSHPIVAGIIIGKTDVRNFPDRKNVGMDRYTLGFTLRDSPDFFINVSAWGSDGYVTALSGSISVGDCVVIENPLVSNKNPEKEDRFCPTTPSVSKDLTYSDGIIWCTSPYRLMVTEAHSKVRLCTDTDTVDRLLPLIHLPVKDFRDFYSLGDIVANGQDLDGSVINILAGVKSVGELKPFTTSNGRRGQRLEVKLFDDSVSSFPLICWDREPIQLVQSLIPRESVLFISDAKIAFDAFRNGMTATVFSKTVITVNPDTREASQLFSYVKEVSESGALDLDEKAEDVTVDSITDVYTVSQLKLKAQESAELFFGIMYSFVSKLDLDSSITKVIRTRCSKCKFMATDDGLGCTNQFCPGKGQTFSATTGFDLLVDLTDHTGTLHSCTLRSPEAEKTLGCTTEEFTSLTDDQRTAMKWKFLLERCKVYIKILPSIKTRTGIRGVILSCSLADPGEVKQHMSALLE